MDSTERKTTKKKTKRRADNVDEGGDIASDGSGAGETAMLSDSPRLAATVGVEIGELAPGTQAVVDGLYDQVKASFSLKKVKASSVINLLTYVMAAVEKQKKLTGPEKKEVVVHLVERLVGEIPGDDEDTLALQSAVQILLPPMIDTIVAATRGQLDLNKDGVISHDEITQATTSCWSACFPCCFKK